MGMTAEALLLVSVILAVAFVLGILIYRFGRAPSAISPVLEQRLQSLEAAIGRSDTILRDEFGRGREEVRESSRSLREEVTGLFGNLSDALRASLGEKLDTVTGQITTLTEGNERRQETLRANVEAKLGELKTDAGVNATALENGERWISVSSPPAASLPSKRKSPTSSDAGFRACEEWIAVLERRHGRRLAPCKPGPKPRR